MVEDIDSIVRLDPSEQVHYEKEQNLYSIIKTIEYLVSSKQAFWNSLNNYYGWVLDRNLLTHRERSLELSMTLSSARSCTNTNFARSQLSNLPALTPSWSNTKSSTVLQPKLSSSPVSPTTEVKRLTGIWLNASSISLLNSLRQWMCWRWTFAQSTNSCQRCVTCSKPYKTILTSQLITRAFPQ